MTGQMYKTYDFVPGASKSAAMERAAKRIAMEGWSVVNTDKELGIISASQTVAFGEGKTVPLNVSIDSTKDGVNIAISFSMTIGLYAPSDGFRDFSCKIIESAKAT